MNEKIVEILSDYTDVDESEIKPESTLIGDLGLTSLDIVDLITAFEDEFSISIPDSAIKKMEKVSDITDYVKANI